MSQRFHSAFSAVRTGTGAGLIEPHLLKGRMRLLGALRQYLERQGYQEVQTPVLHGRLGGFEKGTGFSTFSASLGERLWFRAAPELYLKRLLIEGQGDGMDRLFELAVCVRDEYDEQAPADSFDRPELTLLELYTCQEDPWALEGLLRAMTDHAVARLEGEGLVRGTEARAACAALRGPWERREFGALLASLDPEFDLEGLLRKSLQRAPARGKPRAAFQAEAIAARAGDPELREAAAGLAYRAGSLARYLRAGPQGYWYDLIEHAFQARVAPGLTEPVIVHRLPLESSPMADSSDGVHCEKWELYARGVRIALAQRELMDAEAQRVRFEHLERLRRLGFAVLPEPDEGFIEELKRWPAQRPVIGMGLYVDRLAGLALGILGKDGRGQERMIPNLFKLAAP